MLSHTMGMCRTRSYGRHFWDSLMRLIAGSGRSGTTWVLDCLADANGLRPIFEPLHPARTEIGARYANRLIEPEDSHPELQFFLETIQDIRYWSLWTTYRSPRDRLFPRVASLTSRREFKRVQYRWSQFLRNFQPLHRAAQRREPLIKCIRANLALGWLVKNFRARAIMIVRHPCAVVESQLRLGDTGRAWNPWPIIDGFRDDQQFNTRTRGAYLKLLESKLTKLEALTLVWVIENQLAVNRAAELGYTVIFYEDLIASPDIQWRRICEALELENLPTPGSLRRPSQQASSENLTRVMPHDAKWMTRLEPGQLVQVQRILNESDCELYDLRHSHPIGRTPNVISDRK